MPLLAWSQNLTADKAQLADATRNYQRRALSEDAIEKRHKPPDAIIAVVGGLCLIARHVPGAVSLFNS